MLEVTASGLYTLIAFNTEGCAGLSNAIEIEVTDGTAAPTVAVEGSEFLCEGSVWTLSASEGASYVWSNGETSSSIEVGQTGSYAVEVEDLCGNLVASEAVDVFVFEGPSTAPTTSPDMTLDASGPVMLTASAGEGQVLRWYDAEVGGNLLVEGATLSLPVVSETTSFWAEASQTTTGASGSGGEATTQPEGQYHTNSARWLEFDVFEPMQLDQVTLFANGTYDRSFEIINAFGQYVSSTVNVTDGEFVLDIGFELEPGNEYGLRCTTDDPQLWREGTASTLAYPYDLAGLGSITNSTAGPSLDYYYFFYNWEVSSTLAVECTSPRAEVVVTVTDCTDPTACNFNPAATVDDGSCEYTSCAGDCVGDLNGDGSVSVSDLLALLADFGCNEACSGDIDGDGLVTVSDLLTLLSVFGQIC